MAAATAGIQKTRPLQFDVLEEVPKNQIQTPSRLVGIGPIIPVLFGGHPVIERRAVGRHVLPVGAGDGFLLRETT